jgi:hypothetical protein
MPMTPSGIESATCPFVASALTTTPPRALVIISYFVCLWYTVVLSKHVCKGEQHKVKTDMWYLNVNPDCAQGPRAEILLCGGNLINPLAPEFSFKF